MNNDFEIRGRETAIFIKTSKGEMVETLISTDDLEKVRDFIGNWLPVWSEGTKSYYVQGFGGLVNNPKKNLSLHRWIMDEPENFVIDHIDGDTLNNRYSNLRRTSHSINVLNRENTGVVKYKDRWKAQFTFEGKRHTLGYFDTEEEARKVLESEKEKFISLEQFQLEYEYDLQKSNDELENDDEFNIVQCGVCGSQNTLEHNGVFDTRGNHLNSFFECSNCGAENSGVAI